MSAIRNGNGWQKGLVAAAATLAVFLTVFFGIVRDVKTDCRANSQRIAATEKEQSEQKGVLRQIDKRLERIESMLAELLRR